MVKESHLILGYDVRLENQPATLAQASTAQSSAAPVLFTAKGLGKTARAWSRAALTAALGRIKAVGVRD